MPLDDSDRLADSIETASTDLIGELKGVRDSVEELYILLDHIWRNREELRDIVAGLLEDKLEQSDANESVACCQCNAFWPSLAAAVRHGWTAFQCDDEGDWAYLAVCLDCQKKQADDDRQRATLATEMGLMPVQVQHAVAEGVTTVMGLRRIEKNTRNDTIPETIACARCDTDSPPSLATALQEGWTDLCRDDGTGWNYLGICPECLAQEIAESEAKPDEQKRLFA
jgi:hypothetical protein